MDNDILPRIELPKIAKDNVSLSRNTQNVSSDIESESESDNVSKMPLTENKSPCENNEIINFIKTNWKIIAIVIAVILLIFIIIFLIQRSDNAKMHEILAKVTPSYFKKTISHTTAPEQQLYQHPQTAQAAQPQPQPTLPSQQPQVIAATVAAQVMVPTHTDTVKTANPSDIDKFSNLNTKKTKAHIEVVEELENKELEKKFDSETISIEEAINKTVVAVESLTDKVVEQLNLATEAPITTYPDKISLTNAGFDPVEVYNVCEGKSNNYKNYKWKYV